MKKDQSPPSRSSDTQGGPSGKAAREVFVVLLILLSLLSWRSINDYDLGIHLAGGRWIVEQGQVPDLDPLTYTVSDHEYVAYHWLYQLLLWSVYDSLGVHGLILFRLLILFLVFLIIADILRIRKCHPLVMAVIGLLGVLAAEWRLSIRPELMSYLLLAATMDLFERRRAGALAPLWLLPIIQCIWINTHVYILGWAIMGAYALEEWLIERRWRQDLASWMGVSLLALLLNPYHLRAMAYPFLLFTRLGPDNVFGAHISELVAPFSMTTTPQFPFTIGVPILLYKLLLILGFLVCFLHLKRRRLADLMVVVTFGALSLLAIRNIMLYLVAALPAICTGLQDLAVSVRKLLGEERALPSCLGSWRVWSDRLMALTLGLGLLMAFRVVSGSFYHGDRRSERFGASIGQSCLGLGAVEWLVRQDLVGPGFNNLNIGGTLLWLDRERKIFIDGRNEVSGDTFFREYLRLRSPAGWRERAPFWNFEYVIVTHPEALTLIRHLLSDVTWKLVYVDESATIFVRAEGPNGRLPAPSLPMPVGEEERWHFLQPIHVEAGWMERLARWIWNEDEAMSGDFKLGTLLLLLGYKEEAERPLLRALRRCPSCYEISSNLASLYYRREMWEPALVCYRNVVMLGQDNALLRKRMGEAERRFNFQYGLE